MTTEELVVKVVKEYTTQLFDAYMRHLEQCRLRAKTNAVENRARAKAWYSKPENKLKIKLGHRQGGVYAEHAKTYRAKKRKAGLCYEGGCHNLARSAGSKCTECSVYDDIKRRASVYKYTPEREARFQSATHCDWCLLPFGGETPAQDHDHNCCDDRNSCGKCLRGLVHGRCNNFSIPWFEWYERTSGITLPLLTEYRLRNF